MNKSILEQTLDLVAARCPDPTALVFARLFSEYPETEPLFVRDTAGLVRGQMLAVVMEGFLDFAGDQAYAANLIGIERINHVGLGVEPAVFDTFFAVVVTTFRDILGPDWSMEMETAWTDLLDAITARRGT